MLNSRLALAGLLAFGFLLLGTAPAQADFLFDLADAVGGGDGSLPGTGGNGDLGATVGTYTTFGSNAFVDGTFVPNNTSGAITIDGAANTYDFDSQTSTGYYNPWRNGNNFDTDPSGYPGSTAEAAGLPNFNGDPNNHSLLSGHANKGITFDLDAVRSDTSVEPHQFTAYAGDSRNKGGGSIVYYVFVDGLLVQSATKAGSEDFVAIPISSSDRYLTLAISDANNGMSADHGYFGDPFLISSTYTWDGGDGTSQAWSERTNWSADVAPISSAQTEIVIAGNGNLGTTSVQLNQDIAAPMQLNRLVSGTGSADNVAAYLDGGQLQFVADGATQPTIEGDRNANTYISNAIDIPTATTLAVSNRHSQLRLEGIISGDGSLSVSSGADGEVWLTNANTYTGGTTVTGGTLQLGANDVLADSGAVTVDGGTLNINTQTDTVGALTLVSGSVAGTTGVLTASSYQVQSGTISAMLGGSGTLTKTGTGTTVTLSGSSSTYSGDVIVAEGILRAGTAHTTNPYVFGTGDVTVQSGATLDGYGVSSIGSTVYVSGTGAAGTPAAITNMYSGDSARFSGKIIMQGDTTVGGNNANIDFNGGLGGTGTLTKVGTDFLWLPASNDYDGAIVINGGTVGVQNPHGFGNDVDVTVNSGGTVRFNFSGPFSTPVSNFTVNQGGKLTVQGTSYNPSLPAVTLNGGIISGYVWNTTTPGVHWTLTDTITHTGTNKSTIDTGGLVGLAGAITFDVASGSGGTDLRVDATLVDASGYTGGLVKTGPGTMVLNAENTYTGGTTVSNGTLQLGANDTLADSGAVTVDGGTLDINTQTDTVGALTLVSGSVTGTTGVLTASSYQVQSGTISAVLGGSGALEKTGNDTVLLTQSGNNYSGGTTVTAGTLELQGGNNGQSTVGTGDLVIQSGANVTALSHNVLGHGSAANIPHVYINGGTLTPYQFLHLADVDLTGGTIAAGPAGGSGLQTHSSTFTTHASADTSAIYKVISMAEGGLTFDVAQGDADTDLLVAAGINGGGGVSKLGDGTMVISANTSYTGTTTVSDGTLLVDGTHTGAGTYTVQDGGTLGGTGTIDALIDVELGGTLAPGASVGQINLGELSMAEGSLLELEFNSLSNFDFVNVEGAAHLDCTLELIIGSGFSPGVGDTFDVLAAGDGITFTPGYGVESAELTSSGIRFHSEIVYDAGTGISTLRLQLVPEPATLLVWSLLAGLGVGLRWRRRTM